MQLAIAENPDWNLHQVPLQPEPDKYPIMSQVYNVIFGINPELQELHDAFNEQIAADLGRLHQRRGHGQIRPRRQGLVHAAAAGGEPAHRRRSAEGLGGAERRPLLLAALPSVRAGSRQRPGASRPPCPSPQPRAPWIRCSGSSTCTRASASSRFSKVSARGRARREARDHRPERLGQDDAPALRQLSREADLGPHLRRRHADRREAGQWPVRPSERSRARPRARRDRLRLPALQPVPASHGARQRDRGAAPRARPAQGRGRGAGARDARQGRPRAQGRANTPSACRAASSSASRSRACSRCSRS